MKVSYATKMPTENRRNHIIDRTAKVKPALLVTFVQIHVKSLCLAAHIRIVFRVTQNADECTDIKIIESDIPFDELEV